ncbi:uncharacterized protein LOC134827554 [Culicoides brevitarsis]|uniref:uncharacterized protein LOC134827554 n=1 Tax=Culicoides brevitarsis TaxID=469753 RepID=UPI00307B634A
MKISTTTCALPMLAILFAVFSTSLAIRCYQCSSATDMKGVDSCGAYKAFNRSQHIAIECNSDESHMPGSFCMKVVNQSPRGFIWDGRWRQVIRRCASVAETGVTGVCNWGVYENGVYWEECYCAEDQCNKASSMIVTPLMFLSVVIYAILR